MSNVQSIVTPAKANGAAPPKASLKAKLKNGTAGKAPAMTADQAIAIAFEAGDSFASIQSKLSTALITFKGNDVVRASMLAAMNCGYLVRKLGYTREQATACVAKSKYNEKIQDDSHRTLGEQRIVDTVRVLWHRANKLAGTLPPKSEAQVAAETTRATKEAEKKAHEARLEETWEIVHPKDDVNAFDALSRLVLSMKAIQKKHAAKLVGARGTAWRDWLASAPK